MKETPHNEKTLKESQEIDNVEEQQDLEQKFWDEKFGVIEEQQELGKLDQSLNYIRNTTINCRCSIVPKSSEQKKSGLDIYLEEENLIYDPSLVEKKKSGTITGRFMPQPLEQQPFKHHTRLKESIKDIDWSDPNATTEKSHVLSDYPEMEARVMAQLQEDVVSEMTNAMVVAIMGNDDPGPFISSLTQLQMDMASTGEKIIEGERLNDPPIFSQRKSTKESLAQHYSNQNLIQWFDGNIYHGIDLSHA